MDNKISSLKNGNLLSLTVNLHSIKNTKLYIFHILIKKLYSFLSYFFFHKFLWTFFFFCNTILCITKILFLKKRKKKKKKTFLFLFPFLFSKWLIIHGCMIFFNIFFVNSCIRKNKIKLNVLYLI